MSLTLDLLPSECLDLIVSQLEFAEVEAFSQVDKRIRAICCRHLFRYMRIKFSRSGFLNLPGILSSVGQYVVYITYEVPDLLKEEILDFPTFVRELYPYTDYLSESGERFMIGITPHPPYMELYEELARVCREQREIINQSLDFTSMVLAHQMPRLKAVDMAFESAVSRRLRPILYNGLTLDDEGSYHHHLRVVLCALKATSNYTLEFRDLQLPRMFLEKHPSFNHISSSIPYIIHPKDAIRYERASMVLQAFPQLLTDMEARDFWISRCAFEIFLASHTNSPVPLPRIFASTIEDPIENIEECTFNIWEPGWRVRVRKGTTPTLLNVPWSS